MKTRIGIIIGIIILMVLIIRILPTSNKEIYPKVTGNGDITIACVGDSITYGLGVSKDRNNSWVSLLANKLGNNYQTINYGLNNGTLLSSGNLPYEGTDIFEEFWNNKENIIIFMLGTNDTKSINWDYDKYNQEYREILDKMLKEKNGSKIYIVVPPQIYINNPSRMEPNRDNLENGVIPIIGKINEDYNNVELIDLYTLTLNHQEWFDDNLHPNKDGNIEIANEISRIIKETYDEKDVKRISK